ncbi:MAG: hypothetical protein HYX52_09420 [Chloroflexi bacterium]|nr:hypothetical protein [Chloroflexota bacterium]
MKPPQVRAPDLVKWLLVVVFGATIFWLGYSTGQTTSVAELLRLQRDADTDRYTLARGRLLVQYERLGGGGKPFLLLDTGVPLVELSDWDPQSRITIDGTASDLVRLFPRSSVDYGSQRLVQTLQGSGWQVEREVRFESDTAIRISHFFVARRPIRRVELSLAHTRAYFLDLEVQPGIVLASFNTLSREQLEAGQTAPATDRLRLSVSGPQGDPQIGPSASFGPGPTGFVVRFAADSPPLDRRVPLGDEIITWQPA